MPGKPTGKLWGETVPPGQTTTERVPVPGELATVADAADRLILALDDLILARQGAHDGDLLDWEGTARTAWEGEFAYSQADLQAQIDELQAIHATLEGIRAAIREHNAAVDAANGDDGSLLSHLLDFDPRFPAGRGYP